MPRQGLAYALFVTALLIVALLCFASAALAQSSDSQASYETDVPFIVDEAPVDHAACNACDTCADYVCPSSEELSYRPSRVWGRAEYLGWWVDGMDTPPLVTTSPDDTPREQAGVLGEAGTEILFGGSGLCSDGRSGGRFQLGMWLDPCDTHGVEATYLALGQETETFAGSSDEFTILARPFFDIENGVQASRLIAYPDFSSGSVSVAADTEFKGVEVLFRQAAVRSCSSNLDFLLGWRWAQLDDTLRIEESTLSGDDHPAPNTAIDLLDRFDTENSFHGLEFGVSLQRRMSAWWSFDVLGKTAIGNTKSVADVFGQTTTTANDETTVTAGGLLAQPTNMGRYNRSSFAGISELQITLRRQIHVGLELTFGYTLIYWSDLARAGDQIDSDVNLSQRPPGPLVGAPRPEFEFRPTNFWAQGMNIGLHYRF